MKILFSALGLLLVSDLCAARQFLLDLGSEENGTDYGLGGCSLCGIESGGGSDYLYGGQETRVGY